MMTLSRPGDNIRLWLWLGDLFRGHDVDFLALIMMLAVQSKPSCLRFHPPDKYWPAYKPHWTTLTQQSKWKSCVIYALFYAQVLNSLKGLPHAAARLMIGNRSYIYFGYEPDWDQASEDAAWLCLKLVAVPRSDVTNLFSQLETWKSRERRAEGQGGCRM